MEEKTTGGKCVVCKGIIIERITATFNPARGAKLMGTAVKSQYQYSSIFYCGNCGLKYEFLPKPG